MSWGIIFYMSDLSRLLVYSSTRNYKNDGFAGRFCIIAKVHYYANSAKTFCRIFVQAITSRALRIFFLRKPFNYTLVGLTICCIVGCVCMVCALNPTLMTGLSCPEMGWPFFILFPKIGWPFYAVSGKDSWYANFHYPRSNCSFVLETFHYLRRKSLLQTL